MKSKKKILLTSLLLMSVLVITNLQEEGLPAIEVPSVSEGVLPQADRLANLIFANQITAQHFTGVALIVQNNHLIYQDAFGYANAARLTPNDLKIAYPIASLQKFMTGVLISQLIAQGKLSYDTNINAFYKIIPKENQVTIRNLLDHTSGIRMAEINPGRLLGSERQQVRFVIKTMAVTDDKSFSYTNANYTLLSGIVAQITGKDYEEVLKEKIIQPLGLKATYDWKNRPHMMPFPRGYNYRDNLDYQDDEYRTNRALFASLNGAGGLFMSIGDMLKMQRGLTNGQLISQAEYYQLEKTENAGYAGGIWHENGLKFIHGSLGGYDTVVYGNENNQNLVILFANQPAAEGNQALAENLFKMID